MRSSKQLINSAASKLREAAAPSSDSLIAAGQAVSEPGPDTEYAQQAPPELDKVDAINRLFAELELAYHNQYHKAYGRDENLQMAKQLWFDALRSYSSEIILKACRSAIAESEYLPSLHMMHRHCRNQLSSFGLSDPLSAYREACNASSPKCNYDWSHPAVYYAGQACEWRLLASETESQMLPVFERHYQTLCEQVLSGEKLQSPAQEALPSAASGKRLSQDENRQRLKALRDQASL